MLSIAPVTRNLIKTADPVGLRIGGFLLYEAKKEAEFEGAEVTSYKGKIILNNI